MVPTTSFEALPTRVGLRGTDPRFLTCPDAVTHRGSHHGSHVMKTSISTLLSLAAVVGLTAGMPNPQDFVGTYNVTVDVTYQGLGSDTQTTAISITEGQGSDLIIQNGDCPLPVDFLGDSTFTVQPVVCSYTETYQDSFGTYTVRWEDAYTSGQGSVIDGLLSATISGSFEGNLLETGEIFKGDLNMDMNGARL